MITARRPSAGFLLLCGVIAAGAAFFAWGLVTPDLDVAWRLEIELKLGRAQRLAGAERRLLQGILLRHPAVAEDLLDGARAGIISRQEAGWVALPYAYLIRTDAAALQRVRLWASASKRDPIRVCVEAAGAEACGEAGVDAPFVWELPVRGPFPQLIEVRIGGAKKGARWVKVEWEGAS